MERNPENPAMLLPLWDVFDSVVVTTNGVYLKGMELRGLDSEHIPAASLLRTAESLYRDLATQMPEQTMLQLIMESHSDHSDLIGRFEKAPKPAHQVLDLQRKRRMDFIKSSNPRRHSAFLFFGNTQGFSPKEFRKVTADTHAAKMSELRELANRIRSMLGCADVGCRDLSEEETLDLFWRGLNPGTKRRVHELREEMDRGRKGMKNKCPRQTTIRESLFRSEASWNRDFIKVGDYFQRVLTLRDLPASTEFTDMEVFYQMAFDLRLCVTVQIPPQQNYRSSLDRRRRIARADAGRGGNIEDYQRTGRMREGEELAELLCESGQRLVLLTVQAALSAPDKRELDRRTREFQDRTRSKGYIFFEETAAHDRELFKTLPGGSATSERQLLVTSNNAVDCLPIFQEDTGDRDPVMILKTGRGEIFNFDPFAESRDNWNATIFGASGAGKSVFVNLLVATSVLASSSKGRLIVVDFAGPEKSSYLMLGRLFGGHYVPVITGDVALNPFPPPEKALDDEGNVRGQTEAFLTVLTDLLLSNTGQEKENQLFRNLIQRGIRDTYRRINSKEPIYGDLLEILKGYAASGKEDKTRLKMVLDLLDGFLKSPDSRLFNKRSSASPGSEFLILDLFGVDGLEPHIAQAVTFLTAHWVKEMAFDASDPGNKYVILDEVAQLIKRREMAGLVDELYSTARKHRTSVWTVTQSYQTYRQSALADAIKLNSTTQIFLSHANDESGRKLIAEDYMFSRREKKLFDQLKTVKGRYSTALMRTDSAGPEGDDKRYMTSVIKIELSPFDYQVCTSDARDREIQRRYIEANPDKPLHEVLEYIALRKTQGSEAPA